MSEKHIYMTPSDPASVEESLADVAGLSFGCAKLFIILKFMCKYKYNKVFFSKRSYSVHIVTLECHTHLHAHTYTHSRLIT